MQYLSRLGSLILRLKCLLMATLGAGVILYEVGVHIAEVFPEPHYDFIFEISAMGIALPLLGGYLLTNIERYRDEYERNKEKLRQHRILFQELANRQDLEELKKFVVQYPGALLPLENSSLFIYDHRFAELMFMAGWNRQGARGSGGSQPAYKYCRVCLSNHNSNLRPADHCPFDPAVSNGQPLREFCVDLSYHNVLIGILRLTCMPGKTLAPEHVDFMNAIAPELALTLALALAHTREIEQVRMHTQQLERQQTAMDLHNSLAQQAGFLHLNLDRLANGDHLPGNSPLRGELEFMRQVANEIYEQVRSTLVFLRSWEDVDLTQAMAEHYFRLARRAHVSYVFRTTGESAPVPVDLRRQIFNLLQEGLNNVEKHAEAKQTQVTLNWFPDCLKMSIIDDGRGFDPRRLQPDGHYGLTMMRELVKTLRGEIEVESSPNQGTRLHFTIPLTNEHVMAAGGADVLVETGVSDKSEAKDL